MDEKEYMDPKIIKNLFESGVRTDFEGKEVLIFLVNGD